MKASNPPLKVLPDGRGVWVYDRPYNAILVVGPVDSLTYDEHW
jgi:hypothetical protein